MENLISQDVWTRIRTHARLVTFVTHLDRNVDESLTLADAAKIACMERTAFSKFFRKATGVGYRSFVHSFRISRATLLIQSSDASITQVSHAVGYSDISTFERRFRAIVGVSPTEYRRRASLSRTDSGKPQERPTAA